MPAKNTLIIIVVLSVLGAAAFILIYYFQQSQNQVSRKENLPVQQPLISPTPTPVSKPAPVTINTVQGTIKSVSSSSVTLDVSGKNQTFSISGTKDFQKITSGTVEAGDAKTAPSSASELKVGQKVLIIHEIGSTSAKAVYIIK